MNKFKAGDRFETSKGHVGTIIKIGWNSILGEDEYVVTWDHMPQSGECSYISSEAESDWKPIRKVVVGSKAVLKFRGQPFGFAEVKDFKIDYPAGSIEEITEHPKEVSFECSVVRNGCNHEWVDVGFSYSKMVCKKCDKEKV